MRAPREVLVEELESGWKCVFPSVNAAVRFSKGKWPRTSILYAIKRQSIYAGHKFRYLEKNEQVPGDCRVYFHGLDLDVIIAEQIDDVTFLQYLYADVLANRRLIPFEFREVLDVLEKAHKKLEKLADQEQLESEEELGLK